MITDITCFISMYSKHHKLNLFGTCNMQDFKNFMSGLKDFDGCSKLLTEILQTYYK